MPAQLHDTETDAVTDPENAPAPAGSTAEPVPAGSAAVAAAPAADTPPAAPAGPSAGARLGGWLRRRWRTLVAALVVLGLVVGLVLSQLALRRGAALEDARESALQAGRDSAVALATYDHRTLDRDFGAVTDRSTTAFRDSFTQTSAGLRQVLEQYDATATATVVSAGLVSASEDRAVVLVFLNQVATNTNQQAGPTTDQSRVEVTLVRPDERWLIDAVKLL